MIGSSASKAVNEEKSEIRGNVCASVMGIEPVGFGGVSPEELYKNEIQVHPRTKT